MTQTHSDHASHDHAGHDHAGHDHAGHDHAGHDHDAAQTELSRSGRSAADLDAGPLAGLQPAGQADPAVLAVSEAQVSPVSVSTIEEIEEALRDVVDPELGVNVVDLGLIYDLQVGADHKLTIDMTLTSAACPLTDMIEDQISAALMSQDAPLVDDYAINWVWLPPWGPERITDDGREQLRALGFNI